jgi:hypothetical protein
MLLLSAATAFRGDSVRRLLWSDLFMASVPIDELGLGTVVQVRAQLLLLSRMVCLKIQFLGSWSACRWCQA